MKAEELKEVLVKHKKWLMDKEGGERAVLSDAFLSGADLSDAVLSDADLSGADLSGADLSDAVLRRADLSGAFLSGADLSDAVLSGADLSGADLSDADLSGAFLSGADLSDAVLPKISKVENLFTKILEAIELGGKLNMSSWHTCETTHCMAGWTTTLAGEAGRVAEELVGTPWVASIIIRDSCPYLEGKNPNFYSENDDGMAFIKECAAKEKRILENKPENKND